jgi:hypothetical protein
LLTLLLEDRSIWCPLNVGKFLPERTKDLRDIGIRFSTARDKWSSCAKKKKRHLSEIPGAVGIQHSGFVKPSTEAYEMVNVCGHEKIHVRYEVLQWCC